MPIGQPTAEHAAEPTDRHCSETGEPLRADPDRQAAIVEGSKAYNSELHHAIFALPNYVKRALKL